MSEMLEQHERAEHLAHGAAHHAEAGEGGHHPSRMAALLVAVLAAALAVTEQGAKHAEIRVEQGSIAAADAWSQYQAKSTRATIAQDVGRIIGAFDAGSPEAESRREKVVEALKQDQEKFEKDPADGKGAIASRAHRFEEDRNYALEQTHSYHNGAAAMELGIVLSTASAIIGSRLLIWMALAVGVAGVVFALLGLFKPELGAV